MRKTVHTLIIGAGPQGLALARALVERGDDVVVLEAARVGSRWRNHYESLRLFTPRAQSALPGLLMKGEQQGFPTKDEFAAYLQEYAVRFHLPIVENARVHSLTKEDERFIAHTEHAVYEAKRVVVAIGTGDRGQVPVMQGIVSIHSFDYHAPSDIPPGTVLVVGNGNSAAQIAVELSQTHDVDIGMRTRPMFMARSIFGKSMYEWISLLRIDHIDSHSLLGRLLARSKDLIIGLELKELLKDKKVRARSGVRRTQGNEVIFDDGRRARYGSVIWATGPVPDYSWIQIEGALDVEGRPVEQKGVSPVPGLFYMGLRNQVSLISHTIYGAARNIDYLLQRLELEKVP